MPTRDEMIAELRKQDGAFSDQPTRQSIINELRANDVAEENVQFKSDLGESSGILKGVGSLIDRLDSVTGAPVRSAIGAVQSGKDPLAAYSSQFGSDPTTAPTGKDIALKAGVSGKNNDQILPEDFYSEDEAFKSGFPSTSYGMAESARKVSPAGVAGFGVDIASDPTTWIPTSVVAKGAKMAGEGALASARVAKSAGEAIPVARNVIHGMEGAIGISNHVKNSAADTAKSLKKLFTPTVSSDYKDLLNIAKKNGIDPKLLPESIEFGENSFISRASRNRSEGLLGQEHLNRFRAGYEAVQDAAENKISNIAKGSVPGPVEAGEMIRSGFDTGIDNFFDSVGMTHNKVVNAIPGLTLAPSSVEKIGSKLSGLEKWAKGRAERGFTNAQRGQGEQLLRAIEAVKSGNGSYKQTVEALRDIGDVAFKSKNVFADIPPDIQKFRDLYFTLDDALIDTVEKAAGAPVAKELKDSNKAISEFFGEKSVISSVIGNKNMAPERVFETLIQNGDTKKIEALKKILPAEVFDKLKGSFLASNVRKNADDIFSFKTLHNSLRNKKNVVGALFSPEEINDFGDIVRLGSSFGEPVLSTSGTGASSVFRDVTSNIGNALQSDSVIESLKESARKRGVSPSAGVSSAQKVSNPEGKKALSLSALAGASVPAKTASIQSRNDDQSKSRGTEKWARDGFRKLQQHAADSGLPEISEEVLSSNPKIKSLLIQASDLRPGTPAMKKIFEKISSSQNGGE